jgi:hypothetical protein
LLLFFVVFFFFNYLSAGNIKIFPAFLTFLLT